MRSLYTHTNISPTCVSCLAHRTHNTVRTDGGGTSIEECIQNFQD